MLSDCIRGAVTLRMHHLDEVLDRWYLLLIVVVGHGHALIKAAGSHRGDAAEDRLLLQLLLLLDSCHHIKGVVGWWVQEFLYFI